jgi:hypothetical protein
VLPEATLHIYGVMPPLPVSWTEYGVPTLPARALLALVIVGNWGIVSVVVAYLVVSLIETAITVIVCEDVVAAGAV